MGTEGCRWYYKYTWKRKKETGRRTLWYKLNSEYL